MLADIINRPIVTEKTLDDAKSGRYTFEVQVTANKDQIRQAANDLFGVKVVSVRTQIIKEKQRLIAKQRRLVRGRVWKKAIIEIKEGKIDAFEVGGK